ncbi:PspC domain-containing protein [Paenibacillus sp. GD4]|uniref:PspC domain-containing protein n=1 Tax=Paenibacillus sp. GD4 TaxID=3068890 RepID=UPI00279679BE|nr:PspC domain-containing protein [Paenibacillus sp. GD4]MDQ1911905.1 PspC domain-containing protein [Paenibacillus sp. GD4]
MTKLYRSRVDRKLTGLCGGLAEVMNIDSTLLRVIVVGATILSSGAVIPFYLLTALVVPKEPWNGIGAGPYGSAYGGGPAGPGSPGGPGFGHQWGQHFGSWKEWRKAERYYRKAQRCGWTPPHEASYAGAASQAPQQDAAEQSHLDEMMKDIEKKAMWKEIEELRAKVAQYEKQNQSNQTKGDV